MRTRSAGVLRAAALPVRSSQKPGPRKVRGMHICAYTQPQRSSSYRACQDRLCVSHACPGHASYRRAPSSSASSRVRGMSPVRLPVPPPAPQNGPDTEGNPGESVASPRMGKLAVRRRRPLPRRRRGPPPLRAARQEPPRQGGLRVSGPAHLPLLARGHPFLSSPFPCSPC